MKNSILLLGILVLSCFLSPAQTHRIYPQPPEPMGDGVVAGPRITHVGHLNAQQLEHDARLLSELAQSVPADIDSINRGLLPKNLMDKLKRIEKLSKQLRSEVDH